jgi:hypothetical protein
MWKCTDFKFLITLEILFSCECPATQMDMYMLECILQSHTHTHTHIVVCASRKKSLVQPCDRHEQGWWAGHVSSQA